MTRLRKGVFSLVVALAGASLAAPAFATGSTVFTNTDAPDYTAYAGSALATLGPVLLFIAGAAILVACAIWALHAVGRMFGTKVRGIHHAFIVGLGGVFLAMMPSHASASTAFSNADAPVYTTFAGSALATLAPVLLFIAGAAILVACAIWALHAVGRMFGTKLRGIHH